MKFPSISPRKLFLLDGTGALVSAISLGLVLPLLQEYIGLPVGTLRMLGVLALCYALWSLACYFFLPEKWPGFMKIISLANLSHCVLTAVLLLLGWENVQPLGWLYFGVEMAIVLPLAWWEWKVAVAGGGLA